MIEGVTEVSYCTCKGLIRCVFCMTFATAVAVMPLTDKHALGGSYDQGRPSVYGLPWTHLDDGPHGKGKSVPRETATYFVSGSLTTSSFTISGMVI